MRSIPKFMAGALALVCFGGAVRAQVPIWDTLTTQCTRLVVDDRCEVGLSATGGLNLDYTTLGGDCDPNASVYLKSGGPFAVRKVGTTYTFSSSLWQTQLATSRGWELMPSGQTPGPISGPGYTGYQTSTMWNADHSIAVQKTYYAPSATDSCNFIIQKSVFFGVGGPKTNVTVGEMIDWDVPSDSLGINTSTIFNAYGSWLVYQRGTGTTGCQPNENRYAAVAFLGMYRQADLLSNPCANDRNTNGYFAIHNDTIARVDSLSNSDEGEYLWNRTLAESGGLSAPVGQADFSTMVVYKCNATLDSLTVYTALVSVKNGNTATLAETMDKTQQFYRQHLRPECPNFFSCCWQNNPGGRRGNVDCDPNGGWDISDLSRLIDYLYISYSPLCCPESADWNGDGKVDIEDIVRCIEFLYICFGCLPANCN